MPSRDVLITGLGPVSAAGAGVEGFWNALTEGRSFFGPIRAFDASTFDSPFAAEVPDGFTIRDYVPKSYRKATKVMARDIELAVAGAELAAEHARVLTKARIERDGVSGKEPSYPPEKMGVQIGAGLIAADLTELTAALAGARDADGRFDIHLWGEKAISDLTPLWLLKYLPNMPACHVTILHDAQGPSNTITCGEVSALHSVGEAMRFIGRGDVELCFCGGMESKINPMSVLRQIFSGRFLKAGPQTDPKTALRPFDRRAQGAILGEGGAILVLESAEGFAARKAQDPDATAYAKLCGFAATQSLHRHNTNRTPDPEGVALAKAMELAMEDAGIGPEAVDLIIPFGCGHPDYDQAEMAAIRQAMGRRATSVRICPIRPMVGLCGAGTAGLDMAAAALALHHGRAPAVINCDEPWHGLNAAEGPSVEMEIGHVLVVGTALGGQNAAMVLGRADG